MYSYGQLIDNLSSNDARLRGIHFTLLHTSYTSSTVPVHPPACLGVVILYVLLLICVYLTTRTESTQWELCGTMSVTDDVPAELWLTIFELMDSPGDLNNVIRTCRRFYNCGVRALHRDVVWKRPEDFVRNAPLWLADPGMIAGVRSLQLYISTLPDDVPGTLIDAAGVTYTRRGAGQIAQLQEEPVWLLPGLEEHHGFSQSTLHSINYYKMYHTYATTGVYNLILAKISSFTNLRNLTFKHLFITDELFGTLFDLPGLRKLHIEFCLFPRKQTTTTRDFSILPITDLTMLNLRRQVMSAGRHGHDLHAFADMDEDIEYGLALASAKNLQSLRVDSTADVFATVYRRRIQGVYVYSIPPRLTHLYVQRKQVVDGAVQPLFHAEQLFPGAVYSIMERCPTLTTVSLGYALPKHSSFPKPESLPNLTHCEGYLEAISAMTTGRPLKAISILRSDASLEGIIDLLDRKAAQHPGLRMLALHCKTWDLEILDAICQLFPELRKLKLTFDLREPGKLWEHGDYWNGIQPYEMYEALEEARARPEYTTGSRGPDEDTVVSIGPHHLHRLEHLHTAHIYAMPSAVKADHPAFLFDSTFDSVEEELQNLVIPWNRYCKKLREVQLHAGYVMRRKYEGDIWRLHEVNEVSDGCDFVY
jgi:hypothetical protein